MSPQSTHLPRVNQDVVGVVRPAQDAHGDDVVEPVLVRVARLEHDAEMNQLVELRRALGADVDAGAVVGRQLVARVRVPDAMSIVDASVGSQVGNGACKEKD
ncbi:hypothetical protein PGQ11_001496 [Apiospora arundinis]|uniref:Uncharacterized protein n=1 Tax=Apiospora arundinis TaxID=335852 RepID=A0ABR2JPH8_9PEZI